MKKKLRIVLLLMSLALIGVLGFQGYWIVQTYQVNQQQLNRDIDRVLTIASERYLGRRAVTFFTSSTIDSSSDLTSHIEHIVVRPHLWTRETSQKIFASVDTSQSNQLLNTGSKPLSQNAKNVKVTIQMIDINKEGDSVLKKSSKASNLKEIIQQPLEQLPHTLNQLTGTMKNSAVEQNKNTFITADSSTNLDILFVPQLKYMLLDSILQAEFEKLSLEIPFKYAVLDEAKNDFLYISDTLKEANLLATPYHATLATPFSETDTKLLLLIENKNQLLIKKMTLPILTSVVLVALIFLSLGYALKTILGQKKLSEIKNDFINNMTHEFKTPISTISLALEAIVHFDVQKDKEKTAKYLDISRHQTERLGMMVEKVLRIATSEKSDIKLNLEKINVHQLIEQVKENIEMQIKEKQGNIQLRFETNTAELEGDSVHLSNVLYNLIDNANKYSPEQPTITVSTQQTAEYFKVSVQDQGIGIAKQHRKHIFDKFYRVPTGNVHDVKGFGLGLSYVAMIVQRHHGKVEVTSEPNKGSTFSVYLPFQQETQAAL